MQPSRSQARFTSPTRSLHSAPRPQRTSSLVTRPFNAHGEFNRATNDIWVGPQRPKTTPKPRVQRLLLAPGQGHAPDRLHSPQSNGAPSVFMTRLPDSPPRLFPACSSEPELPMIVGSSRQDGKCAEALEEGKEQKCEEIPHERREGEQTEIAAEPESAVEVGKSVDPGPRSIFHFSISSEISDNSSYGDNDKESEDDFVGNDAATIDSSDNCDRQLELEINEEEPSSREDETDGILVAELIGPLPSDISIENAAIPASLHEERQESEDPRVTVTTDSEPGDGEQGDEYASYLAERARVLDGEAQRQRVRQELGLYVDSLRSRTDTNGERLLEFPKNYQQVLSLMSHKDVRDEDPRSNTGKDPQKSWSRVLLQSGLSKQHAFGVLKDGEDESTGDSGLAAKIALKMALVQQLDNILEEKLGRNLYPVATKRPKKASRRAANEESDASNNAPAHTFVTQPQSVAKNALVLSDSSTSRSTSSSASGQSTAVSESSSWKQEGPDNKASNFIERNKQVVANGMRANLTRDEELRLELLLRNEVKEGVASSAVEDEAPATDNDVPVIALGEPNEFALGEADKQAILDLLATKDASYQLVALDQPDANMTNEPLPNRSGKSVHPSKGNVIQENKRERAERQRLGRIDQELKFLQEFQSITIVGDDEADDDADGCRSEKSCTTVASVAASSTCSTRSGVISRREFNCFLAQQKKTFHATPTASANEIRQLLLSMNCATTPSIDMVTATTG